MTRDSVEKLLTDAVPLVNAERLTRDPDGGWLLVLDADTQLEIEYDEAVQRLVLSCDVAALPPGDRLRTLEFLLAYNHPWAMHGGVRTALDQSRDWAVALLDIPASFLTVQTASAVLANFHELAQALRRALAVADAKDGGAPGAGAFPGPGAVRA